MISKIYDYKKDYKLGSIGVIKENSILKAMGLENYSRLPFVILAKKHNQVLVSSYNIPEFWIEKKYLQML